MLGLDLDLDPHSSKSLVPDQHIMNADPKLFMWQYNEFERNTRIERRRRVKDVDIIKPEN
jgi:hypothetical protein